MKLEKIELTDFRQFKGHQEIEFSTGSLDNVTVVYGENGRGKTGIFRALMFCLYGDRSLSQDELTGEEKKVGMRLVNEIALREKQGSEVVAKVTVGFSHKENRYTITRKVSGLMGQDNTVVQSPGDQIKLQESNASGNTLPIETDHDKIKSRIQEILNSRLRDYFLFDGERIERLTRNTKERRAEVRQGIRALLDLDAMDLAIRGLDKLMSQIEKDIKNKSTGELQKVTTYIYDLSTKIESLEKDQVESEQEVKRLDHRIRKISEEISANKITAAQERKRQQFIQDNQDKKVEKDELKKKIAYQLNTSGQLIAHELVEQLREELELRREKGQLPPDVRKEFVERLLLEERCICGSSLDADHAAARSCLQEFLAKHFQAGLGKESEDLLGYLNRISSANKHLANEFNRLLVSNKKLSDEIDDLESKIKMLGEELGAGGTNVDDLAKERSRCEEDKKNLERVIDRCTHNIGIAEKEREEYRKQANVLEKKQSHLKSLADRRNLTEKTLAELKAIYESFADEVKRNLAEKSTENFTKLADDETQKDIKKISIDENYMLDVLNWSGQQRLGEISAGQRQIVSLAFIMALIQVAGDLEVPLFMDTPFGRLSGVHRDHLLDTIPKMASQWILLATDTEFTTAEANVLRQTNSWGKIYELVKEEEGITRIVARDVNQFTPSRKTAIY
jgi:DNA sulfur modification protein DndD